MSEAELAEKFNSELDAVLNGAEPSAFVSDPGAMALAARFARADYSAESRIRESLRERLEPRPGMLEVLSSVISGNYARAAFAAAALAVLLFPFARRQPVTPVPAPLVTPSATQASRPAAAVPAVPAAARAVTGTAGGVFASLPMPALKPVRVKNFPIEAAGRMNIHLTEGREVSLDGGSGVVWETEGGAFILERRAVAPGELFEVRTL